MSVTRRGALRLLAAPVGLAALGLTPSGLTLAAERGPGAKLKVLVAGGHPDDPESGCGGTMARYADAGHDVVALYLTRGEAGIEGTSHVDAARIRT
ncbi:MAG: PIG-L family deacetylase, partial [Gemmatimonadaceae bacterium]|nr:PIG-L family deacetylase [Gemmatimonadaceae bacterium]